MSADKPCPYCGYLLVYENPPWFALWTCGTWRRGGEINQSRKCARFERYRLQTGPKAAEAAREKP